MRSRRPQRGAGTEERVARRAARVLSKNEGREGASLHWSTKDGACELLARPGTLIRETYADEKENALMAVVAAAAGRCPRAQPAAGML